MSRDNKLITFMLVVFAVGCGIAIWAMIQGHQNYRRCLELGWSGSISRPYEGTKCTFTTNHSYEEVPVDKAWQR
jgi:hypothetical protein